MLHSQAMGVGIRELPGEVAALQGIVRTLQTELAKEKEQRLAESYRALKYFEELQALKRRYFDRTSEKLSPEEHKQLRLFNEAEQTASEPSETPRVEVKAHARQKPGRKPLPADLPRQIVVHDIPDAEKHCACGQPLVKIREEVCEKLDIVPPRVTVIRHVRPVYACHHCEGSAQEESPAVKRAAAAAQLLPKSLATPGLLAYIVTSKFCDSLPYYRQNKIFERLGIDISRQDMANWTIAVARRVDPLVQLLKQEIRSGPVVHIDETTVQVLQEPGRPATSKSWMWVFVGGQPDKRCILYHYHPSRSGSVPEEFLGAYQGFLQTDGFEGYARLGGRPGITHAGCWAHARRKFFEAKQLASKAGSADEALARIASLYAIEKRLRAEQSFSPEQFMRERKTQVMPILDKFHAWLAQRAQQVPPSVALGKAIAYTLKEWPKLLRYLDSPYLTPDNNACEQAIRPFVLGRKNWLFSGSPVGAHASAALFSLIETAKANDVEPYLYLRYVFSNVPDGDDPGAFKQLLPWAIEKASLLDFRQVRLV